MGIEVKYSARIKCVGKGCNRSTVIIGDPSEVSLDTFRGNALEELEEMGWAPAYDLCDACKRKLAAEGRMKRPPKRSSVLG